MKKTFLNKFILSLFFICSVLLSIVFSPNQDKVSANVGGCENLTWTSRTSSTDSLWSDITYGNGLFVAVSYDDEGGNNVMTSPDGINWTGRVSGAAYQWTSVTYGNGLFVAGSNSYPRFPNSVFYDSSVITSPDGINWSYYIIPSEIGSQPFQSITYGNGLFVGTGGGWGNMVVTSPDGVNWTSRSTPYDGFSSSDVTFGNGLFVMVVDFGDYHDADHHVMTSPDGINWTARTSIDTSWQDVTYGNGLFVAVSNMGLKDPATGSYTLSGNRIMTSPDGINWTSRASSADSLWTSVTYGNGLFVAVASNGGINSNVMTSPDGINWTNSTSASNNSWTAVTYGDSQFVAVSNNGTGNRVMTGACSPAPTGEFIPAAPSCVIPLGGDSCDINFSWSVANPIGNSAITKPVNVTVATGNSGVNVPLSVKYNFETFYLYNNATALASRTVTSSCISGTVWDGNTCSGPPSPTITGPTSGNANTNYTYTITGTDPNSYDIRYGVDWTNSSGVPYSSTDTMDGMADIWLPASGYVVSGTSQDTTLIWTTAGVKKFQALTQNEWGINSSWATHTIDIQSCSTCAEYVSQIVPYRTSSGPGSAVWAGEPFTASVTMKNVGISTWRSDGSISLFHLGSQVGSTWGTSVILPAGTSVAPNSSYTFTMIGTAPSTPGTYSFQWKMGKRSNPDTPYVPFDEVTPNTSVNVISPLPSTPTGLSANCVAPGSDVTLSWSPSSYATSYFLRYYQTSGSPGSYSTQTSPFSTSITPNINYTWNVYASNSTGNSSVASGTFTCPNTSTVTIVNVNPITGGRVVDGSGLINCGSTCSGNFSQDSTVILQAIPNSSYWQFNGWGGDCTFAGKNFYCSLDIDADKSASATFITRLFNYGEF